VTSAEPPLSQLNRAWAKHLAPPLAPVLAARGLGPYRGYAEILDQIEALVARGYRLEVLGRSVEGEPIFALCLGAEARGSLARTSVVLSAVHPLEWIGVEAHLRLLQRLDPAQLGERALISIPVLNPDGLRRVEKRLRAFRLASVRDNFVRHNARGVDLNRNFDASWGRLGLVQRLLGGVFNPGSGPASEPEVESLGHYLAACRVDRALSLHSFGGAVLFPSAATTRPVHDQREHERWARRVAVAVDPRRPYVADACARWAKGIVAGGLELDWFHERHGALSLLVECSRGGRGLTPGRLLSPFAWFNPPRVDAEAEALASALAPFVRGDAA